MSDSLTPREQVERHLQRHPEHTDQPAAVAGATGLDPATVQKILNGDEDTTDPIDTDAGGEGTGDEERNEDPDREPDRPDPVSHDAWETAEFTRPEGGVWPEELLDREQWMGHRDKMPFAPWADRDHPDAAPDEDARWKWGLPENYVDGHDIAQLEVDPRIDGRAFLQQEDDPYAYVDGDDVRDPDTGDVHPAFIDVLERLGLTYADVSQSGAGVHAQYRGELPDGVKQAKWDLDTDPWGSNDDLPSIEIYAGKRVCVATGDHVPGTPTEIREWDDDALQELLDEHDLLTDSRPVSTDREDYDLDDYDPDATTSDETTTDIRDVFTALDRLDAQRVADRTIVSYWNDDASTSDGERAFWPTWGTGHPDNPSANIVNSERWQDTGGNGYGGPAVMAAIDAGLVSSNAQPSDVRGENWFKAIIHLRDLGFDIPEYVGDPDEYRTDPRDVEVVLNPERAWNAASNVTPDDVSEPLALDTTDDGDAWQCPVTSARIDDVARAVALHEGIVASAEEPLTDDYARAYQRARDHYDAPLPEYLTAADAVQRYDYVIGAVRELTFHHLDRDALTADITGEGLEVPGEAQLTLDPTPVEGWRDSTSGESVIVFPSGTIYDAGLGDDGQVIDTLRFVALDAGLIDDPTQRLAGEDFTDAYRLARDQYGAPLPRWHAGDPDVTPVLPPADQLVDDPTAAQDDLERLRNDVEDLYADLATDPDHPHVLTALPALGKTTAAIKTARSEPTTYLAPRKELMAQAATKADNWGVGYAHLPVFSEESLTEEALQDAVEFVRDRGKDQLRDRWTIHAAVAAPDLFTDADPDPDDPEVELARPSCPTANGDHGDAWAVAVHTAYHLDYTPRDIHERAEALFGTTLPCQDDGDCPYSAGWDDIADPDACPDLLIGSYVHAHVESARTYYTRDEADRRVREPRTLVLDEYPGQAYSDHFGEEALDHAVWLASALRDDVDDRQDLLERDLWTDPFVNSWLKGDAAEEDAPLHSLHQALGARADAHEAVSTAQEILSDYDELLASHNLKDPLQRLVEHYPNLDIGDRASLAGSITTAVGQVPPETDGFPILQWVRQDVGDPLAASTSAPLTPDLDALPDDGELRAFVEQALQAADDHADGAIGILRSARSAVAGGDDGCRELAVWADDGYAHRQAHYLLEAAVRPGETDVATIPMTNYTFGSDRDETTAKQVGVRDRVTVLLDRNHHGAVVHSPPDRISGSGDPAPLVGLDATGREPLWAFAVGEDVEARDVHDGPRDRAQCLREVHGLQVVQTARAVKPYEGDPNGKNLDADVALLEEISEQFAGIHASRDRDQDDIVLDDPAVITTKVVRDVLEDDDRAATATSAWENYGNLTGSNELGDHQLAALLGCQHYGDHEIELLAALEGEQIERSGHGATLDYGSEIANAYLQHMQDDQVMQAALRFTRGGTGALVFAHTAALRADLPVVGEGQVMKSWSATATAVAREWQRHPSDQFTISDVADAVDVGRRQVRRVLAEFVDAGYLQRHDPGEGVANEYDPLDQPGAGEVQLDPGVSPPADGEDGNQPGRTPLEEYYTANARVPGVGSTGLPRANGGGSVLPAPESAAVAAEGDPPGE